MYIHLRTNHYDFILDWQLVDTHRRCRGSFIDVGIIRYYIADCATACRNKGLSTGSLFAYGRHGQHGCKYYDRWQGCQCHCFKGTRNGVCDQVWDEYDLYTFV